MTGVRRDPLWDMSRIQSITMQNNETIEHKILEKTRDKFEKRSVFSAINKQIIF